MLYWRAFRRFSGWSYFPHGAGFSEVPMGRHSQQAGTRARRRVLWPVLAFVVLLAALMPAGGGPAAASTQGREAPYAAGVQRGIWDDTWVRAKPAARERILGEIADADQLGAGAVRLTVFWRDLEPLEGVFNEAEIGVLSDAIDAAREHGLRVILTFYSVPLWASDSSLWGTPPNSNFKKKTYYDCYIPRQSAMPAYEVFIDHLTTILAGKVFAWECWNEPNLWWFWYPQKTSANSRYGSDRYIDMLQRFSRIVRANDPGALVLGGNSASLGFDNRTTTSPITWANRLKQRKASAYFDAYSHHPYACPVMGRPLDAPETSPVFSRSMVTLGNIGSLLKKFPDTDFYLTEYGYNTRATSLFGGGKVSEARQADYLRRAFRRCARYPQIQLLIWYLRKDVKGGNGVTEPPMYSGLRRANGVQKPAWWAFARRNVLTLKAPRSVRSGAGTTVGGTLKHAGKGVGGKVLTVQRRKAGKWVKSTTCRTRANGSYRLRLRVTATTRLRVVWTGVVESPSRTVAVR